jgi:hypothetical protein
MATAVQARPAVVRPATVTAAVLLTVFGQLASIPFIFAPGADEIPAFAIVIGAVAGVLSLVGAWGMWNLRRWGMILTFVLTALNTLTAIPGLFEPPSGWILGELIALIPVGFAILVLIALPSSRRAFREADPS